MDHHLPMEDMRGAADTFTESLFSMGKLRLIFATTPI